MSALRTPEQQDRKRTYDRALTAARYAKAKRLGLCWQCRFRKRDEGYSSCSRCRRKHRHHKREERAPMVTYRQRCSSCGEFGHKATVCAIKSSLRCSCGLLLPCDCVTGARLRHTALSRPAE